MRVGIVGAGLAGLACAQGLKAAGHEVALFDKGRGPGGRMSSRRLATPLGEVSFDHGAQYFTVSDFDFRLQVEAWTASGHAALWSGGEGETWVGTPAMNAPIKAMARNHHVLWSTRVVGLDRIPAGWRLTTQDGASLEVDAVVVAVPAEQAAALLEPVAPGMAARARGTSTRPCWSLMLAFDERLACDTDRLIGREGSALGWAARNSAKPGRAAIEAWVVHAGALWSEAHLDTPAQAITSLMTGALSEVLGQPLPAPIAQSTHRWLYARSGTAGCGSIWEEGQRLGVCGDWLIGPRVEAAWVSGTGLARTMVQPLQTSRHPS